MQIGIFDGTIKRNLKFGVSNGRLVNTTLGDTNVRDDVKGYLLNFNYDIGYKIRISENLGNRLDLQPHLSLANSFNENSNVNQLSNCGSYNIAGVYKC